MPLNNNDVDLSLLDNAIDFILRAVKSAMLDDQMEWKYAVLHLAAGIELLLKARLSEVHWSLTFANVDKATRGSLQAGDFRSVDVESSISRLRNIAEVQIDDKTLTDLEYIRNLRNRIQHFGFAMSIDQTRSVMARGLHFAKSFLEKELSSALTDKNKKLLDGIYVQLSDFDEFVDVRIGQIEPKLNSTQVLIECAFCLQESLEVGSQIGHCHFCNSDLTFSDIRSFHSKITVGDCHECGGDSSLVFLPHRDGDKGRWSCSKCDASGKYTQHPMTSEDLQRAFGDLPSEPF